MMQDKVALRIYQSNSPQFSYHDLFVTGLLSQMVGHGVNNHKLKPNSFVLIVAKPDINEDGPIDVGFFKVISPATYNPWKAYGHFMTYDAECIHHMQFAFDTECTISRLGSAYSIARSINPGHQNSKNTRELAFYLTLNKIYGKS